MIKIKLLNILNLSLLVMSILILFSSISLAYKMSPPDEIVHQYITNESQSVWRLTPSEIKTKLSNNLFSTEIDSNYDVGDDIITGSGEEDKAFDTISTVYRNHYWDPDVPNDSPYYVGTYKEGLLGMQDSAYTKALRMWQEKVIPLYLKGKEEESYYWLGRVAHLLQDSTVTSHMHLDCHADLEWAGNVPCIGDDSALEEFTANSGYYNSGRNYLNWNGSGYQDQQYNYDSLIDNFDWDEVDSEIPSIKNSQELFRLFWYTAQKTQYFASDKKERDFTYKDLDENIHDWNCSGTGNFNLWADEGYTSCNDFINKSQMEIDDPTDSGQYVAAEANAMLPHAMKATAGLYKLFWDAVHVDWPFYHHDLRRTGFTILKGDLNQNQAVNVSFILEKSINASYISLPSISDIDQDGRMEMATVSQLGVNPSETNIYILEYKDANWKQELKVTASDSRIDRAMSIADLDKDGTKEIIFIRADNNYVNAKLYAIDDVRVTLNLDNPNELSKSVKCTYALPSSGVQWRTRLGHTAIEDINLDGNNEILFTDFYQSTDTKWYVKLYVLSNTCALIDSVSLGEFSSSAEISGAISIANVNTSDERPEIVVPVSYGGTYVMFDEDNEEVMMVSNFIVKGEDYIIVEIFDVVNKEDEE